MKSNVWDNKRKRQNGNKESGAREGKKSARSKIKRGKRSEDWQGGEGRNKNKVKGSSER